MDVEHDYEFYDDFPTKPIGRGNPYHRCAYCHVSVPEINYKLKGHLEWCEYRQFKEREIALNESLKVVEQVKVLNRFVLVIDLTGDTEPCSDIRRVGVETYESEDTLRQMIDVRAAEMAEKMGEVDKAWKASFIQAGEEVTEERMELISKAQTDRVNIITGRYEGFKYVDQELFGNLSIHHFVKVKSWHDSLYVTIDDYTIFHLSDWFELAKDS